MKKRIGAVLMGVLLSTSLIGTNVFAAGTESPNDPSTLISELNVSEGKELMEEGYIGGGMLPKIQNCIDAIENGVSRVHILDGRIPHCLLLEIFTNKGIGTAIKNDVEERYYHGE